MVAMLLMLQSPCPTAQNARTILPTISLPVRTSIARAAARPFNRICSEVARSRIAFLSTTSGQQPSITGGNFLTGGGARASRSVVCSASGGQEGDDGGNFVGSLGLFALWGGLAAYAFLLSPNQTPYRDQYFIEKFVGLTQDTVPLNTVFSALFYIMGVWPLVYTALLVPAAKSQNGVPAWPFFTLSYAFGAFALLPFMALWQPPEDPPQLPPAKEDLEGTGNLLLRGMESPYVAWLLLAGAVFCIGQAATAGTQSWTDYSRLVSESRLVHVTTIDFLTLTTLAPFWMDNDAALRKWEGRDTLLPILSFIPVLGPCIYLCLRPRAQQ